MVSPQATASTTDFNHFTGVMTSTNEVGDSRFRFSLTAALWTMSVIAIAMVSLRSGSWLWARILFMLTLGHLLAAVLASVYRRGAGRAFWSGFAIFGWTYLVIANIPSLKFAGFQLIGVHAQIGLREFFPEGNSWAKLRVPGSESLMEMGSFPQIISSSSALLFAAVGGLVGMYLYCTRTDVESR